MGQLRSCRWTAAVGSLLLLVVPLSACGGSGGGGEAGVRLQPATAAGPDPFSASVVVGRAAGYQAQAASAAASTTTTSLAVDRAAGTAVATGTAPRLYGGTGDTRVCDPGRVVDFLSSHRDKAAAWAKALGIARGEVERYVAGLTPVLLTTDTRVTNHGYRAGRPTSFQAVLQAGTAVMVDARGVPRVKCNCGNPLTPPRPLLLSEVRFQGAAWSGYDPAGVITVRPGARVESFTLVNVRTGADYTVPVGSPADGTGGVDLRTVDWADRSYAFDPVDGCGGAVSLRAGRWTSPDGGYGVGLAGVRYGDLTGDGAEEALVTLECSAVGGNAYPVVMSLAFGAGSDGPAPLGDAIVGASPAIAGGAVTTSDPVWAAGDPRCCPSSTTATTWRFQGGRWVASGPTPATPPGSAATPLPTEAVAPPRPGAASGTGPCTIAALQAAVSAAERTPLRVIGVSACDGNWAAPSLAFTNGDETSALYRWSATAWEPAGCMAYQNPSDPFTPRPGTVPLKIYRAGCAGN